ncbi:MAG: hypothetical protein RQ824_12835 [bacterium]|nr:hypothetical protein [bacterium]
MNLKYSSFSPLQEFWGQYLIAGIRCCAPPTNPTLIEYDVLDRQTKVTLPDNTETEIAYGFEDSLFLTKVTDAKEKEKKTLKDIKRRKRGRFSFQKKDLKSICYIDMSHKEN